MTYLLPRGASPERPIVIAGSSDSSHRTVCDFSQSGALCDHRGFIGFESSGGRDR